MWDYNKSDFMLARNIEGMPKEFYENDGSGYNMVFIMDGISFWHGYIISGHGGYSHSNQWVNTFMSMCMYPYSNWGLAFDACIKEWKKLK